MMPEISDILAPYRLDTLAYTRLRRRQATDTRRCYLFTNNSVVFICGITVGIYFDFAIFKEDANLSLQKPDVSSEYTREAVPLAVCCGRFVRKVFNSICCRSTGSFRNSRN